MNNNLPRRSPQHGALLVLCGSLQLFCSLSTSGEPDPENCHRPPEKVSAALDFLDFCFVSHFFCSPPTAFKKVLYFLAVTDGFKFVAKTI